MAPAPVQMAAPRQPMDPAKLAKYIDLGIAGAAAVVLIFAFLPFYAVSGGGDRQNVETAWGGPLSAIGVLLVVLGGAAVALMSWGAISDLRLAKVKLGSLGALVVGWVFLLISLFVTVGLWSGLFDQFMGVGGDYGAKNSRAYGCWVVFVFATLAAGGAVFAFIQSRPKPAHVMTAAPGMAMPQAYGAPAPMPAPVQASVPAPAPVQVPAPAWQPSAPASPVAPLPPQAPMGLPPVVPPPAPGLPPVLPPAPYQPLQP